MNNMLICFSVVEWVMMITQSAIAITAIIMSRLAFLTYSKTPIQKEVGYHEATPVDSKSETIVFDTPKQRTKLTIEDNSIICYLLDKKNEENRLQWKIEKEEASKIVNNRNIYINPSYKPNTGTFFLGIRKNWLYSKNLFPNPEYLRQELFDLIKKTYSI